MFGLENAFKKITDFLPDKEGAGKGKKGAENRDVKVDKGKDKDQKDERKDGKMEESKKPDAAKTSSKPPAETYEDYLIACVRFTWSSYLGHS